MVATRAVPGAVATALRHSAQRGGGVVRRPTGTEDSGNREEEEEEVHEMYGALRRQNRLPPGKRPEPLEEVSEPQVGISGTRGSATRWCSTPWCRRWRNSWWKSLTFQFLVVGVPLRASGPANHGRDTSRGVKTSNTNLKHATVGIDDERGHNLTV